MTQPVGKAMVTDEHGRVHDECPVFLEDGGEFRSDGGFVRYRFAKNLMVDKDHPVLTIDWYDNSIYRDIRQRKLDEDGRVAKSTKSKESKDAD